MAVGTWAQIPATSFPRFTIYVSCTIIKATRKAREHDPTSRLTNGKPQGLEFIHDVYFVFIHIFVLNASLRFEA